MGMSHLSEGVEGVEGARDLGLGGRGRRRGWPPPGWRSAVGQVLELP
jgi:hypothetical protein